MNAARQNLLRLGLLALSCLSGCATLPEQGPSTGRVLDGAKPAPSAQATAPYVLVDLTPATAAAVTAAFSHVGAEGPRGELPPARPVGLIGPGDILKVTLWQPDPTGAALIGPGGGAEFAARVAPDGTVTVPYVGRVKASRRTPAQVEASIGAALISQTAGARASVMVDQDVTNAVILEGAVGKTGILPLEPDQRSLLDVLALAGGPRGAERDSLVRITRDGSAWTVNLARVVADPSLDVELSPGDRVMVTPHPTYFYAFGAVGRPGEQPFDADEVSMVRTLARISGLDDQRANARGVFVFRRQDAALTARVAGAIRPDQDPTRVVYHFDMRDPNGFFASQSFRVMPEDVVYVSDAPMVDVQKVLSVVNGVSSIAQTSRNLGTPY
jgi:polysaccharide export outer membrane protein